MDMQKVFSNILKKNKKKIINLVKKFDQIKNKNELNFCISLTSIIIL